MHLLQSFSSLALVQAQLHGTKATHAWSPIRAPTLEISAAQIGNSALLRSWDITSSRHLFKTLLELALMLSRRTGLETKTLSAIFTYVHQVPSIIRDQRAGVAAPMATKLIANTTTGAVTTITTMSTSPHPQLSSELRTFLWQLLCLLKSSPATRPQSPLQMSANTQLLFVRRMRLNASQSVVTLFAQSSMSRSNLSVRLLASPMTAQAVLAT